MEISPALHEIIVAVSRKAVDERMEELTVTRRDFDEVRVALQDLATAQTRSEERIERLEAAVERLAEAQARTEARLERLEAAVERLAEAQTRTEARVEELAAAQAHTEARLERLEAAVERLAEAQARTEARVEELAAAQARTEARVEELAAAQAHTEARLERLEAAVERLAEAQTRTEARLEELAAVQKDIAAILDRFDARIADLRGWQLELRYQERAVAYFGPLLRRMRVVPVNELEDELEARLSQKEFLDLLELDLLISGQPRYRPDAPQVWLAVEVSAVVDWWDVKRARQRAALLRRVGYRAIPTVAGEYATPMVKEEALAHKMLLIQNGRAHFWEEALQEALAG